MREVWRHGAGSSGGKIPPTITIESLPYRGGFSGTGDVGFGKSVILPYGPQI
jgi:hypothetical protein